MTFLRPLLVSLFLLAFAATFATALVFLQQKGTTGLWLFGGCFIFAFLAFLSFVLPCTPAQTGPAFTPL